MISSFHRYPARRKTDDQGAILLIAMIVVTVVALVTGLVLTRGDGSLRATVALRNVAGTSYAADGAAQVVLNGLRTGYWDESDDSAGTSVPPDWRFINEDGDGCFGRDANSVVNQDNDLELTGFYPPAKSSGEGPTSAYVECKPEIATGVQGTARHVTNANSPGDAIILLGNSGTENGLYNFNKRLAVRGGVRSNTNIVGNGEIQVNDANVRARTGCTGTVTVSTGFTKSCSTSGVGDPAYAPDAAVIPELRAMPTCGSSYVEFQPGYYDDAAALESLINSCNKTVWFRTGTYYFDFHNRSSNGDPLYEAGIVGSTDNEWLIPNRRVIGGELVGGGVPSGSTAIPGACQNPIDSDTSQGVQFIFGGDSRINFGSDSLVELCATYRTNRPPIVIFGAREASPFLDNPSLTTLTGPTSGLTPSGTPTVSTPPGGGSDGTFTPITAAAFQADGGGIATWTRTSGGINGGEVRTVTLPNFAPPAPIEKGAVLKAARLVVRHKSAQNNAGTASTVKITPTGGSALATFGLDRPGSLTTQTINLKTSQAAVYNALAKHVHDKGYAGASIDYTATVGRTQSNQLDSVRLELEYYVPQMRRPSAISTNCTTTIGGSGCFAIDTHKKSEVYLQGTTYVPLGRINLEVSNTDQQVFRWGVIARSMYVNLNGAYKEGGALIELPDKSDGFGLNGTLVQFNVHVCPDSPTGGVRWSKQRWPDGVL